MEPVLFQATDADAAHSERPAIAAQASNTARGEPSQSGEPNQTSQPGEGGDTGEGGAPGEGGEGGDTGQPSHPSDGAERLSLTSLLALVGLKLSGVAGTFAREVEPAANRVAEKIGRSLGDSTSSLAREDTDCALVVLDQDLGLVRAYLRRMENLKEFMVGTSTSLSMLNAIPRTESQAERGRGRELGRMRRFTSRTFGGSGRYPPYRLSEDLMRVLVCLPETLACAYAEDKLRRRQADASALFASMRAAR